MVISDIQGLITSLKIAYDISKGMLDLQASIDIQSKVNELQNAIFSAQSNAVTATTEQMAMVDKIRELNEEITRIRAWETEKQRYRLIQPRNGSVIYALKDNMANGEPAHWICTS